MCCEWVVESAQWLMVVRQLEAEETTSCSPNSPQPQPKELPTTRANYNSYLAIDPIACLCSCAQVHVTARNTQTVCRLLGIQIYLAFRYSSTESIAARWVLVREAGPCQAQLHHTTIALQPQLLLCSASHCFRYELVEDITNYYHQQRP